MPPMHTHRYVERLVDLLDPSLNRLHGLDLDEARRRVLSGDPGAVRAIDGSFAIVVKDGITVRMARSLDRPMRYFLAKRQEGPALFVADRIDTLHRALDGEGLAGQFHPSYTRMIPAHHVVEIQLVGCPDPDPIYTRFFTPERGTLPVDLDEIGRRYVGAASVEVHKWLKHIERETPGTPIGVCFSGGIDSGSVFLLVYQAMIGLGLSPSRLKAFVLDAGGPDVAQARAFLRAVGLELFLESIPGDAAGLDPAETLAVIEDYKPLDVECASMGLQLCRGIRAAYPEWRHLADGDGGDENLKDYPIEENPELTIRSVVDNLMLYQEGWGVGRIKHSLTYSGGLSRSYVRTYAPARRYEFDGFSPLAQPGVLDVAEGIPFAALTNYDVPALYALKGEIVRRGVRAVTGFEMPAFPKRRFQHGAVEADALRAQLGPKAGEAAYRRGFLGLYGV
jgi:asparagine synthase (glutamine-hydrolysing)